MSTSSSGKLGQSPMLDFNTLKLTRRAGDRVPCPVCGCTTEVPRMRRGSLNLNSKKEALSDFRCGKHGIYISPTTFEYEDPSRSILWQTPDDMEALKALLKVEGGKRTWSRMGRENDEDSLTWNVFWYLHRNSLIADFIAKLTGTAFDNIEKMLFWSVDIDIDKGFVPKELIEARKAIGEKPTRESEPDLIVVTEDCVTIIEVKLNATPITPAPNSGPPQGYRDYSVNDGRGLLKGTFEESVRSIGYELSRFILLCHALKKEYRKDHCRILLITKEAASKGLSSKLEGVIALSSQTTFTRLSWDDVYRFIRTDPCGTPSDDEKLLDYLKYKSCGYSSNGKLQRLLKDKDTP